MAHMVETNVLVQRAMVSIEGQNWGDDPVVRVDVEMTVMFLVSLAARDDEGFLAAIAAFKR